MNRVPPKSIRDNLKAGIDLYLAGYGGSGLREKTIHEARSLASGRPITRDKAVRMRAWLLRHGASKNEVKAKQWQLRAIVEERNISKAPALTAWYLWGGDEALEWVEKILQDWPETA